MLVLNGGLVYPKGILLMAKHATQNGVRRFLSGHKAIRMPIVVRVLIAIGVSYIGIAGTTQYVQAAQTANAYCSTSQKYTGDELTACNDGIRGADCNDYGTIFKDQTNVDDIIAACTSGQAEQTSGGISTTASPSPSSFLSSLLAAAGGNSNSTTNSTTATNSTAYKNAVLSACGPYSNDSAQAISCMYGGGLSNSGDNNQPHSVSDCLSNSLITNSSNATDNQNACIAGASAGKAYINDQNNGSLGSGNSNSILDQLDKQNDLSSYVDSLHSTGQDSKVNLSDKADNNPGSYINGAGKKQPINVMPCKQNGTTGATDGATQTVKSATNVNGFPEVTSKTVPIGSTGGGSTCPAIIWFNGGGWHSDDGTAQLLASGSEKKNGGDNTSQGKPPGGGANERGYTVIEVTYRLGSSGVYYMFEDVMRGVQHVINNAGLYHIDPSKIAIGGDSAGGSLSMRAVASGKSGAKVGIGWSAPTNAFTGLFKSYKSFLIGMDHSTCVPTDLAGLDNTTNLLNGGSGDVAQYGQGLSSNDFSALGLSQGGGAPLPDGTTGNFDALGTITQVLTAAQYAQDTGQNVESISKQLEAAQSSSGSGTDTGTGSSSTDGSGSSIISGLSGTSLSGGSGGLGGSGLSNGVFNLSAKKLTECMDNFVALSPALFASPETPPSILVGFETDDLIDPQQAHDMADKIEGLGGKAEAYIIKGDDNANSPAFGASDNHLGYDPRAVCHTLNFVDSIINPAKSGNEIDCVTGKKPSDTKTADASSGGGGGASNNSPGGSDNGNNNGCPDGQLSAGGTSSASGDTVNCVPDNHGCTGGSVVTATGGCSGCSNGFTPVANANSPGGVDCKPGSVDPAFTQQCIASGGVVTQNGHACGQAQGGTANQQFIQNCYGGGGTLTQSGHACAVPTTQTFEQKCLGNGGHLTQGGHACAGAS
jgi:hypothetical protein